MTKISSFHTQSPNDTVTSDEMQVRKAKIELLEQHGISAWPAARQPLFHTTAARELYENESDKEHFVAVAGRVMAIRGHGKTMFIQLQDQEGYLQLYCKEDVLNTTYALLQDTLDIGDIIFAAGILFRTKTGEITLQVNEYQMLSKCLHPLPDKFHGIADQEMKYRQRYLDLITNSVTRDRFKKRSLIIRQLRSYLDDRGYLEVETPMLHSIPGGAAARPFVTHHNALDDSFYLRIAPELFLKRLIIGGFERVYEVNRNFRNEGVSTRHNPEFTMVEFYTAHQNYDYAMDLVEDLLRSLATVAGLSDLKVPYNDVVLDFSKAFERISLVDAVKKYAKLNDENLSKESIDKTLAKLNISLPHANASREEKIYALFEEVVEKQLQNPTFVIDFPIAVSPLAKRKEGDSSLAARFELFIAGMEIANSFNELNDPFDQAERFKEQAAAHAAGNDEAHHYDADFINALEYGMPPTVGVGVGIDRLIMLLTNTPSIKEVILFPTLKKKSI
jgi:lysyl-tRNA synthetase class 2